MCAVARKFLTGCELDNNKIITLNFQFTNEGYFLLRGFVLTPTGEPLPNAALEITLMDRKYNPPRESFIGVTFSQSDGRYGISLPFKLNYYYTIMAYSP